MGLFRLSPLIASPPPGLLFGAGATDNVDLGTAAALADLNPLTLAGWVNVNTLTANRAFSQRLGTAGTGFRLFRIANTSGDLQFSANRAGGNISYISNNTPVVAGVPTFIAVTLDTALGAGVVSLYGGTLAKPATVCTYGTNTDSSGAMTAEASANWVLGNIHLLSNVLQGTMHTWSIFNRRLPLEELRFLQYWMLEWRSDPVLYPNLLAAYALGVNGTKVQRDLTGNKNDGTVTGATVTRGIPLPSRSRIPYVPVDLPAGGGSVFNPYYYRHLVAASV